MFKVNNEDTRTKPCSSVNIVNFELVIADWVSIEKDGHILVLFG